MYISKDQIIELLETILKALKFSQEIKFKIIAYENALDTLRKIPEDDIIYLISNRELENIEGIGKGISSEIYFFCENQKSQFLDKFFEKYPKSILELFKIRGLGVNKIQMLYNDYNVKSIEDLEDLIVKNANDKKLISKLSQKIYNSLSSQIKFIKASRNKLIYPIALKVSEKIKNILIETNKIQKIQITGQLVRYNNIIDTIEFVALTNEDVEQLLEKNFQNFIIETHKIKTLNIKSYNFIFNEIIVKIYSVNNINDYQNVLKYTIPSREFLISLNDFNLLDKFPPEMQEPCNIGKVDIDIDKIIKEEDIKSVIHFHTSWSDGVNTLEEMYDEIQKAGFQIAVVCDHSKSSVWANGLSIERLYQQMELIDKLQNTYQIKLLKGIECDILNDGKLDYDEDILNKIDIVIAAIHTFLDNDEDQYTQRMIKAIENPKTNIIAHPTGRLLLARLPYPINIYKIIDACASNNVVIEINSTPSRMDLDWQYYDYAINKGVKFAINPDAHSIHEIYNIYFGIKSARKVGIPKDFIINTYEYDVLLKTLKK